jgi:hypothetical protein
VQWGPRLAFLQEKAEEDGEEPAALANRPDDSSALVQELLSAFWVLHDTRGSGLTGSERITLPAIQAYVALFGRPSMDMDLFVRTITTMDKAYRAAQPS